MTFDGLAGPVGARYIPIEPLQSYDSLQRAATLMRESGLEAWPLAAGGQLIGLITTESLGMAMAAGLDATAPVGAAVAKAAPTISASASAASALRMMVDQNAPLLLVTDGHGKYVGILRTTDLAAEGTVAPRPKMVGGMATPLGVYLTNGSANGGVPWWALSLTGASLLTLHVVATLATHLTFEIPALKSLPAPLMSAGFGITSTSLFFMGLRALPLAGIHAAEHMTVHAIERGEALVPEVVRRMPRVHPRCGTNLVAALSIFLGVLGLNVLDAETRVLVGLLLTAILWRPVGSFLQYYVTTKPPSDAQLEMGIRAGKELLSKYEVDPVVTPPPLRRVWNMGILQIMLGSTTLALMLNGLAAYVPGFQFLRVYFGL